jgi:hypothetical protein
MKKGESMYKLKVPVADSKAMGVEPIWSDDYEPANYQSEYGNALNWYNFIVDQKDCRAFLVDWFKGDADKLKALSQLSDKMLPRTYANSARIAMRGFPLTDEHKARIWEKVEERVSKKIVLIDDEDTTSEPVVKVAKKPLVAMNFIVSDVDDEIEKLINGEDTRNIAQILMPYRMSDKNYLDCVEKIEPILAEFAELVEVRRLPKSQLTDSQEQLLECYSHLTTMKSVKDIVKLLETYIGDLKKSYVSKQVAKVRKKKPKDKSKLVQNLKFLVSDTALGVTSIEPINLLNCSEVWTFDTKTRKISKYYNPVSGSITVKGASLVGFDENFSNSRLLRKPETQVKEFSELKKNDLTKWYSAVKSKSGPVRARLTPTTLILKVF